MTEHLSLLETRIAALERVVFGSAEQKEVQQPTKVVDKLVTVNNKLSQTVAGSEKLREAMRQVVAMRQYLDPAFVENLSAPLETKYHIIELSAPVQENRAKLFEQLKSLESVLDSEHIRNAPGLAAQLAQFSLRQAQQAEMVHSHTEEVSDLFKTYSELILALSKQAVYWDQTISAKEVPKDH